MEPMLHVFMTVADKLSFTRAGEALHMTQPAVSQHIRALELSLGAKLLERNNKQVRLSKAGRIVYRHAKEIRALYGHMQAALDDLTHSAGGELAIGASYTFGEYILPHVVADLQARYPLIKPAITIGNTAEIAARVAARELDVGVVEGGVSQEKITVETIAEDSLYIMAAAAYRHRVDDAVAIRELWKEPWIVRESGSGTREAAELMFARHGGRPESVMEFGSTQLIKEAVEAGLGVTLLSHWTVRKELKLGTLQRLHVEGFPIIRRFSLVAHADPFHTKAATLFIAQLREKRGFPSF
ncbi:LysR family transcriptional regulator [Paenibacillus cymbidii]|uniref:LysR family transcriptional regulator n=1 Tax=Paenibacillus cymbidii TaxID=1639034 RepID=UPI0010806D1B|nr:LysR family transcriptional regulator [Paenibacillus cymbidii]